MDVPESSEFGLDHAMGCDLTDSPVGSPPELKVAFETERLRVFEMLLTPSPWNTRRLVYLAFLQDQPSSLPAAHAVVNHLVPEALGGPLLERIEVTPSQRRQGLATELLVEIEEHLGVELDIGDGDDEPGEAWCAAMKVLPARKRPPYWDTK